MADIPRVSATARLTSGGRLREIRFPGMHIPGYPWGMKKGPAFQNVPDMVNGSVVGGVPVPCVGGAKCFTPNGNDGIGTLYYTNQQSPRLLFFHDHAWGITRLNVYAGTAAPYLIVDQVEDDLIDGTNVSGVFTAAAITPTQILPNLGRGVPLWNPPGHSGQVLCE